MGKWKKIQLALLAILIAVICTFSYLMYSWSYAYSNRTLVTDDGTYTGEFKGKIFDGQGTFTFSNGVKYEGHWVNGIMEGYGVMIFANGSKYEGEFMDGVYNGKGKMTQSDGTIISGIWEEGKLKEKK